MSTIDGDITLEDPERWANCYLRSGTNGQGYKDLKKIVRELVETNYAGARTSQALINTIEKLDKARMENEKMVKNVAVLRDQNWELRQRLNIDALKDSKPATAPSDVEPPVRHPDGRPWQILDGRPYIWQVADLVHPNAFRPMTPSEAFRMGALVRYTDPTNPKLMEQKYITRVENCEGWSMYYIDYNGDVSYASKALTLVEPAPENS